MSFALSQWTELARRYPKAKEALVEVRDRGAGEFARGEGTFELFMEVAAINRELREQDATYDLFMSMQAHNPKLAGYCYYAIEALLLERGEYALCASFIPNFQPRFDQIRATRDRTLEFANRTPDAKSQTLLRGEAQRTFIKQTRNLVEILVGVGRKADAEAIQGQAVAVLDIPELQSAVSDAGQKVKQATAPKRP